MKKARLSSRKTPCKQSQFLCQVLFQAPALLHSYSSTAHGKKEISKANQSPTIKLRMPALGNRILSFSALCTDNQSQSKQQYFGRQIFLESSQQPVNLPCCNAEY